MQTHKRGHNEFNDNFLPYYRKFESRMNKHKKLTNRVFSVFLRKYFFEHFQ